MILRITPRPLRGSIDAIPSKSEAHRALICAALADAPTFIRMREGSEDIDATVRCLQAFGAHIVRMGDALQVTPIAQAPAACEADCGESGSTLRFLLPVAAALGIDARFRMHGRLPERPLSELEQALSRGGCTPERPARDVLRIHGRLHPGQFELPGDVSSQYISGMLFALPLLGGRSELRIRGERESRGYIEMTLQALSRFGVTPTADADGYTFGAGCRYRSPGTLDIGGDWSNAAFWLCADALPGCAVEVRGLDPASAQGDRRILAELQRLRRGEGTLDAADIPDLVPALAATACARDQSLTVTHAARLRIKESDRLRSVCRALRALGGAVCETAEGLNISPLAPPAAFATTGVAQDRPRLRGGTVDACGDHRIAMMAAIASCACAEPVLVRGAEAVNKSYPGFWRDFAALGGVVEEVRDA